MKLARILLALLLSMALPLQAIASPHVIARLGAAPVLGQLSSTPQLQAEASRQRRIFEAAGSELGLTPKEYMEVEARIEAKQLAYVTIPRHLDAMTGSRHGHVFVVRDVIIPAKTRGWEIDLQENHQILAVFIPAPCGNVSLLRKPMPVLARARPRTRVLAESTAPPVPQPAPAAAATPAIAAAPSVVMPSQPEPTPAAFQTVAAASPQTHHSSWWPLLLIPIIGFIAGGGHGGITTPPVVAGGPLPGHGGPPPPVPTPTPVTCAPPPPH